jgi:hypothetical protein
VTDDLVDPGAITLLVAEVLDALEIPYFVCGSLASIVHGMIRTTLDVDIVADIRAPHVAPFVRALDELFYVDGEAIRSAVRTRASFNILHRATMFKVDVFPSRGTAFEQSELERRSREVLATDPDRAAFIATAEDTVLSKLMWFRKGNEVSERQWRDVLGIIKTQQERLDLPYLRRWAVDLGIDDLLERALVAAVT